MDFDTFYDQASNNLPDDDGQSRAYFDDALGDLPYRQDEREVGSLTWDKNSRIIPLSDAGGVFGGYRWLRKRLVLTNQAAYPYSFSHGISLGLNSSKYFS